MLDAFIKVISGTLFCTFAKDCLLFVQSLSRNLHFRLSGIGNSLEFEDKMQFWPLPSAKKVTSRVSIEVDKTHYDHDRPCLSVSDASYIYFILYYQPDATVVHFLGMQ